MSHRARRPVAMARRLCRRLGFGAERVGEADRHPNAALRVEVDRLRSELTRTRAELEAEMALLRAELAGRRRADQER